MDFILLIKKYINIYKSIGGAYCTICTCSEQEAVSLPNIIQGETNYIFENNFDSIVT